MRNQIIILIGRRHSDFSKMLIKTHIIHDDLSFAPTSAFDRGSVGITHVGQKLRGIFGDIAPK